MPNWIADPFRSDFGLVEVELLPGTLRRRCQPGCVDYRRYRHRLAARRSPIVSSGFQGGSTLARAAPSGLPHVTRWLSRMQSMPVMGWHWLVSTVCHMFGGSGSSRPASWVGEPGQAWRWALRDRRSGACNDIRPVPVSCCRGLRLLAPDFITVEAPDGESGPPER